MQNPVTKTIKIRNLKHIYRKGLNLHMKCIHYLDMHGKKK